MEPSEHQPLEQGFVSVEQVGDPRVRFVLSSFVAL
jgi:hypothetical protein